MSGVTKADWCELDREGGLYKCWCVMVAQPLVQCGQRVTKAGQCELDQEEVCISVGVSWLHSLQLCGQRVTKAGYHG